MKIAKKLIELFGKWSNFYFLLREIGCDYTHSDTVDGCHL